MSAALRWQILELANAVDERRRRIRERRRARRARRNATDPFIEMDEAEFVKTYRLGKEAVHALANDIIPLIPKEKRRDGIPAMLKILIALCFYASGSYQTLVGQSAYHNVSQTVVSKAVRQVTDALNNPLIFRKYVKWPMERNERNTIKSKFYQKYGIPGVLGCIDGTHVSIIRPELHEERFINRKGFHSLNVMIICDSDLNILAVDASSPGSAHDSMVWSSHPLSMHMNELYSSGEHVFLLGDSGYPLRRTLMTPILNAVEGTPEHYYYKRHVTARNTVERCIGVLKARFRCLLMARQLHYHPITAGKIVNACTILHNIALASNAPPLSLTPEDAELENNFQQQLQDDTPVPAATAQSRRVNPDLQEGRQQQHNLVQNLWRERAH